MKILHITSCGLGGVPRAIKLIAAATPAYEHHVAWPREPNPTSSIFDHEYSIPRSKARALAGIRRIIKDVQPDIIHAHSSWGGLYARLAIHRVPVIYQPHCFAFEGTVTSPAYRNAVRVVEKILAPRTKAFVVLTPREAELARSLGRHTVIHTVPNVSTLNRFGPLDERSADEQIVSMIGRISRQKSPEFFAEVATLVTAARPDVRFRWIGDGDMDKQAELEAAGVEVTGWLDNADLRAQLLEASIYLHTADYEGFPLSVLDAAAMGAPIVVRDIPAFDGSGLVSGRTPEELATQVLDLLGDPAALREVTERGDRLLRDMNLYEMQRAAYDVYDSSLTPSTPGRPAPSRERPPLHSKSAYQFRSTS